MIELYKDSREEKHHLYRYKIDADPLGHVVFRSGQSGDDSSDEYIRVHKVARFVTESEARDYCSYRNHMTVKHGSDDIQLIKW